MSRTKRRRIQGVGQAECLDDTKGGCVLWRNLAARTCFYGLSDGSGGGLIRLRFGGWSPADAAAVAAVADLGGVTGANDAGGVHGNWLPSS
eukprot:8540566-Pyramimonas_sp.AAC.1